VPNQFSCVYVLLNMA